jgi:hypothetical protein
MAMCRWPSTISPTNRVAEAVGPKSQPDAVPRTSSWSATCRAQQLAMTARYVERDTDSLRAAADQVAGR